MKTMMSNIFGPVPSRRLGNSLGVDLVPPKTCTLDCVYCECGPTNKPADKPSVFFSSTEILADLDRVIQNLGDFQLDYITFSGSGEPTLNAQIGLYIEKIKKKYPVKVCVITNSTLLYLPEVRENLALADLVIPSLDAASIVAFERLNRPVSKEISAQKVIDGLEIFSHEFSGEIWLELFFLAGFNDSDDELVKMSSVLSKIRFDLLQLNTLVRPGTVPTLSGLTRDALLKIKEKLPFHDKIQIVGSYSSDAVKTPSSEMIKQMLLDLLLRRSCSLNDLMIMTQLSEKNIRNYLKQIETDQYRIIEESIHGESFLRLEKKQ